MRIIIALALIVISSGVSAQYSGGRQHRDVFPTYGNYQREGWLINPMITFTTPPFKQASQRLFAPDDQVYDVQYRASGRMGIGIEVGRFYLIDTSPVIHSFEFALGVKTLRGVERFEATLDDPTRVNPLVINGDGDFTFSYATANVRANHVKQLSDFSFLQNSIGINADYMFGQNTRYNDRSLPITTTTPDAFLFQVNYRIGFGFKLTKGVIVVPSIETPVLTALPFDDMKSTLYVFNSRYRPLLVRMSFMVLDKKANRKCPTKGGGKRSKPENLFGMASSRSPW